MASLCWEHRVSGENKKGEDYGLPNKEVTLMVWPPRECGARLDTRRSCEVDSILLDSQPMLRLLERLGKSIEISSRRSDLLTFLLSMEKLLGKGCGFTSADGRSGQGSLNWWGRWRGKEVNGETEMKATMLSARCCFLAGIINTNHGFQSQASTLGFCNANLDHADKPGFNRLCRAKIYSCSFLPLPWTLDRRRSPPLFTYSQK